MSNQQRYTDEPGTVNSFGRPNSDLIDYYDDGHIPAVRVPFPLVPCSL